MYLDECQVGSLGICRPEREGTSPVGPCLFRRCHSLHPATSGIALDRVTVSDIVLSRVSRGYGAG